MSTKDQYRQKFRPDDSPLDREVEAALDGVSLESLYGLDKPDSAETLSIGRGVHTGKILSVDQTKGEVFVDFGGKSQGVAPLSQFDRPPQVGEQIEFNVEKYDPREGLLIVGRKGAPAANISWDSLEVGTIVEGVVTGMNKGGLELQIKNMRAFMPAGQVDIFFHKDISTFIGQKLTAEVTTCDPQRKNLIVSRRNVLEREKEQARQKMLTEIEVGQVHRGTVRSIMDFGAFVDLGGLDGLLHVSEISFKRGIRPGDLLKVGDVVDVKIIKFDREAGKLSLSLKQMMPDPWVAAAERYPVGSQITGRVTRVESFGAFVEVEEGLEGLLPVSELSYQRVKHPSEVVKAGDTLMLVVISIDPPARKLSLSLKQAGPDPWRDASAKYSKDTITTGTVMRVVDFGAFVELEPGLEGLVHISELAPQRVKSAAAAVQAGQQVRVRVLEVDPKARRISLSIRRAEVQLESPPTQPAKPDKKKRKQLRGGLDWNW